MKLEVSVPSEFQGSVIGILSKRKGQLHGSETVDSSVVIEAAVPLSQMFGFSTELRSATQVRDAARVACVIVCVCVCVCACVCDVVCVAVARTREQTARAQGKGEFSMEYREHSQVGREAIPALLKKYADAQAARHKK